VKLVKKTPLHHASTQNFHCRLTALLK